MASLSIATSVATQVGDNTFDSTLSKRVQHINVALGIVSLAVCENTGSFGVNTRWGRKLHPMQL